MSQDNLNFNLIAEKLCMSRSKFNYKLKGLTGETPIHFFLKYKLNKAAELLKSGKYNVSEVADITGFNRISFFGKLQEILWRNPQRIQIKKQVFLKKNR